ncbi:hypothetical protein HBB16_01640 [Pseudonocardia sp. MCCB 268]|nr:hypothetical protein [Pseudonocardia cytotoxica]
MHVPADGTSASRPDPARHRGPDPGLGRNKVNAAYPQTKAEAASRLSVEGATDPGGSTRSRRRPAGRR